MRANTWIVTLTTPATTLGFRVPATSPTSAISRAIDSQEYWNITGLDLADHLTSATADTVDTASAESIELAERAPIGWAPIDANHPDDPGGEDRCTWCAAHRPTRLVEIVGGGLTTAVVPGTANRNDPAYMGCWKICERCAADLPRHLHREWDLG